VLGALRKLLGVTPHEQTQSIQQTADGVNNINKALGRPLAPYLPGNGTELRQFSPLPPRMGTPNPMNVITPNWQNVDDQPLYERASPSRFAPIQPNWGVDQPVPHFQDRQFPVQTVPARKNPKSKFVPPIYSA
jgi:hypothetical protein